MISLGFYRIDRKLRRWYRIRYLCPICIHDRLAISWGRAVESALMADLDMSLGTNGQKSGGVEQFW